MDLEYLFSAAFSLEWITVVPAVIIIMLIILHANVKLSMGLSILSAIPVWSDYIGNCEIYRVDCIDGVFGTPESVYNDVKRS